MALIAVALSSGDLIQATLPVFLIIGLGILLRRRGSLQPAADSTLMGLTFYVTYPCLILHALLEKSPPMRSTAEWITPFACGIVLPLAGVIVGWLLAPVFRVRNPLSRRNFAFTSSLQNYGYLPIPILERLFPDGLWKAPLFICTLGIELVIWTVGVLMLGGGRDAWKRVFNPVVGAVILGIIFQACGLAGNVPQSLNWAMHLMKMLGDCAFPLGILMIGASLSDVSGASAKGGSWLPAAGGTLTRMAVLPFLYWAAIHFCAVAPEFRHVLAVQAAMPAAMFPIVLARNYGGDEILVSRIVIATTAVSFLTIPLVLPWMLAWR